MTQQFAWKSGARLKLDPAAIGQELTALLTQQGGLTPAAVVDAARRSDSPLHAGFEWDDSIAAEQYRLDQARYLIRMIVIVEDRESVPIRAFVNVKTPDERKPLYLDTQTVLGTENLRELALEHARMELGAFRRKYASYLEFAAVLQAIDMVLIAER